MANYNNAKDQAQQTSTAFLARLTQRHFALTEGVAQSLISQGLGEAQLPMLASTCLAINVPPNLLRYAHNIPPVVKALKMVTQLGYRAGEDFYTSVFSTNVPLLNEDGEPTDQKAKAPTVVVMLAAGRIQENAKQDDRLTGLMHHVETSVIEDQKEAESIFNAHFNGARSFREAIVAKAELYTYHARSGSPIGSGKPQVFYGFYAPYSIYNGNVQRDNLEASKPKDNYQAPDIAQKRAATKAWRSVTRTNFARDDRPADVRLAALMESAQARLTAAERVAEELGVDMETAIVDGDHLIEHRRKNDKRATALMAQPELDEFDRIMMYGDSEDKEDAGAEDGEFTEIAKEAPIEEISIEKHAGYGVFSEWKSPALAQKWAVERGAYANTDATKERWIALVQAYGSLNADTRMSIYRDWYVLVTELKSAEPQAF